MRLAAAAAVAAMAIAGCGGGDDEGSSNKELSYAAVGDEANKICTEYDPQIDSISDKLNGEPDNDAAVWDELLPKLEEGAGKFKELDPPSELQPTLDEFTSITDQQIELAQKASDAAKAGDKAAYQQVLKDAQKAGLDKQSDLAASKLGAAECIGND